MSGGHKYQDAGRSVTSIFWGTDSSLPVGLTVGCVFSLLLFKRRMWPVTFGVGSGFGMGYSNCEHELNEPYMVHIKDLKKLAE